MATVRESIEKARAALIEDDAETALAACQCVLDRYPKHVEASCLAAEARRELRQLPEAADLFERVLAADPESVIGHWGISTILEEGGTPTAALYELECAWDLAPGHRAIREELMRLRALVGRPSEQPELSSIGLARVYWHGFQYRRALFELRRGLAGAPERLDARVLEMLCLWRLGRRDDAGETAAGVLADAPDCLKASLVRGYARLGGGARGVEEGRKHLIRALALDPECRAAGQLFPDAELAPPLVAREIDLAEDAPTLADATAAPAAPRIATIEQVPFAEEVAIDQVIPEPRAEPAAPAIADEPVSEADAGASAEDVDGANEVVAEVADLLAPPPTAVECVPAWLTRDELAPSVNQAVGAPVALDPQLYAEWADLLGQEVELDADAEARLEEALADATSGGATSGPWREVRLNRAPLSTDATPLCRTVDAAPPPAGDDRASRAKRRNGEAPAHVSVADRLADLQALAEAHQFDAAAEGYRALLRSDPAAMALVTEALVLHAGAHPDHPGLRRALGDAYMRGGRFQKAIEEYNRAVAAAPRPAAVA